MILIVNGYLYSNPPAPDNFPISTTSIPYSDPDIISPGRGAECWVDSTGAGRVAYPTSSDTSENSLDYYTRFQWSQLEGSTLGSYNWSVFDTEIRKAINKGQRFSFGIMTRQPDGGSVSYGGATSSYPQYVHTAMQGESPTDFISGGVWAPNYNSSTYLARLRALHEALYTYITTTSYTAVSGPKAGQSIAYKDVIYCIDIRGFGDYGEWHVANTTSPTHVQGESNPAATFPKIASAKTIIDHHTEVFSDWPLVMMIAGFDGGSNGWSVFVTEPEVAYHALTATNDWGDVGFRRDQWGEDEEYLDKLLKDNTETYLDSPAFNTLILDKYKTAPVTGEPNPISSDMTALLTQITDYHATSFGNGNYGSAPGTTVADRIRAALKKTGYRLEITGGEVILDTSMTIDLDWHNVGIAPTYEAWNVIFELRDGDDEVVWDDISSFSPTLFLPSGSPTTMPDIFTKPSLSPGTYSLYVRIEDPTSYRDPLPLAIEGRESDGSYFLVDVTFPG